MVNFTMLVKGRPKLTKQALMSLGEGPAWCTVLDDFSDPDTVAVMDNLQSAVGFLRVLGNDAGTGNARNKVIKESERFWGRGDYLYLSDNDVFFKPGWLEALIKCYEYSFDSGYVVLGAYNHPYHQPVATLTGGGSGIVVKEVQALALQSMLMRWEIWDEFGPFRETPPGKVCQGEDVDFGNKIRAAGYKLGVVSPALLVNTGITNSCGEKIPGWEMVKAECPEGILCE